MAFEQQMNKVQHAACVKHQKC